MDNVTKAKINLFAVLRNISDLCDLDAESKEIVKDEKLSVQFIVPDVGVGTLKFENGKCTFTRGKGPASLKLWFTSAEHFNKLVDGENTIPMFINVFKVGFLLKTFTKLADRLSYYLQPPADKKEEMLKDPDYFRINTTLTAYTAFFAMAEIANSDYVGKACASRMIDGTILAKVGGGPELTITVKNHQLSAAMGGCDMPTATMMFADMQFAHDILNGNASSFGGMGSGQFVVTGALDMLEQMAKLLNQVSIYLA